MSNENRTPRPRYDLVGNAELPPSTSNNDGVPNGHHPDANYVGTYHGPNYAVHGQHCDGPYRDNLWSEGAPPPAMNSEGQYVHQRHPNIGYPHPGNPQHVLVPPGPSRGEYYIPPAHVRSLSLSFCYLHILYVVSDYACAAGLTKRRCQRSYSADSRCRGRLLQERSRICVFQNVGHGRSETSCRSLPSRSRLSRRHAQHGGEPLWCSVEGGDHS
ncbi:hypothetical protein EDB85DRAFT_2014787 [Lactarius pseudohatsudake]|nr:hypothetical protein EDB85DRAFT_2014779 [Lactarius pseudohatsudake]KAH9017822.1 hypothetical protein EDB85DRAFT_2014787 [Lactarius pseudohatsudake]